MEIEQLKEEALKSVDKMVTTKAKAQAIAFLRDTLLPAVKQFADGLAQALKNSATSKTTTASTVRTGDDTNNLPWIILLIVAAAALVGFAVVKKRRNANTEE